MTDNFSADEMNTGGNRTVVMWKITENFMTGASKQHGLLKDNDKKKNGIRARQMIYIGPILRKECLLNSHKAY